MKTFSKSNVTQIQKHLEDNKDKILKGLNLDVSIVAVGGKFNKERLVIELGMLPTKAEEKRSKSLKADMEIDAKAKKKAIKSVRRSTKLEKALCVECVETWFDYKERIGTIGKAVTIDKETWNIIGMLGKQVVLYKASGSNNILMREIEKVKGLL